MKLVMILTIFILLTGCAELVLIGHSIVVAGKAAEYLLGYHKPTPTPTPEK